VHDSDQWPQAPILADLPPASRLDGQYDVERLRDEVNTLRTREWLYPRVSTGEGVRHVAAIDWRSLPLRSIGGDSERSDPGGPALSEFADTPWLAAVPYMAGLLQEIPAPLRSVRLMALGPGTTGPLHHDTKCGLPWGTVRLHVPIVTTPGAVLEIDGVEHRWQPGEWWYGDFSRPHRVRNTDDVTRIHLVIDAQPTEDLLERFREEFRTAQVRRNTLLAAPVVPLGRDELLAARCRFRLPDTYLSFEEPDGAFLQAPRTHWAELLPDGDSLVLAHNGEKKVRLIHIGHGEFRFAGWTTERTMQVKRRGGETTEVILRSRAGDQTRELAVAAEVQDRELV
jgi:hypothetical protein